MDPKRIEAESFRRIEALVPREERERLDLLARLVHRMGGSIAAIRAVQGANTAREALGILLDSGLRSVIGEVWGMAFKNLRRFLLRSCRLNLIILNYDGGLLWKGA